MAALVNERDVDVATDVVRVEVVPQEPNVIVNASVVEAGTLRGSYSIAGVFATKGSNLTELVFGSEDLFDLNGSFTSEVGVWPKGAAWVIHTQRMNASAASNGTRFSYWKPAMVIGRSYTVTLDIPTRVSGTLSVYQASGNTPIPNTGSTGVGKTVTFVATQTTFEIISVGFEGSIDNLRMVNAAFTTALPVQNTVDFPASGLGMIFDPNTPADYDIFSYTGKTATTLTGIDTLDFNNSLRTHPAGCMVIPLSSASITIDQSVNEMRYFADNGSGTVEQLVAIGLKPSAFFGVDALLSVGTDDYIAGAAIVATVGGGHPAGWFTNTANTGSRALIGQSYFGIAIDGDGETIGVRGRSGASVGATGGWFQGNGGQTSAITLEAQGGGLHGVHIAFRTGLGVVDSFAVDPGSAQELGDIYLRDDGRIVGCTNVAGTTWRAYVRDSDAIWAANGNAAGPGISFFTDQNTGMYRRGADQLGFSSGGIERMYLSSNDLNVVNSVNAGNGTAAAPTFTFIGDTNTGMFWRGVDVLGFSAGGLEIMYGGFDVNIVNAMKAGLGTIAEPSVSFIADPDTGMYRKTTNQLGFVCGGVEIAFVGAGGNWLLGSSPSGDVSIGTSGLRVGTTGSLSLTNVLVTKDITGGATAHGVYIAAKVLADVTSVGYGYRSVLSTADAADMAFLIHYGTGLGAFGVGSNVDNHVGFNAGSDLTASGAAADRVYGFRGAVVADGVKAYNLFMSGTAPNFMQGDLEVVGTISGAGNITRQGAISLNGPSSTLGFTTNAGGTSVQITSKSTAAPALNRPTGTVTMHNANLLADTGASFTMANSVVGANDIILATHDSVGTVGAYNINARSAAGQITFTVRNVGTVALAEAIVIRFIVLKSANS